MLLSVFQVACDTCETPSEVFDGAIYTRSEVRKELKKKGWVRFNGMIPRDICPRCAAVAARKKAA